MMPQTPGQPGPGEQPAQLSSGNYEFADAENISIERAATSSMIWAVCAMVGAALLGTLAVVQFMLNNLRGAVLVVPLFLVCAVAGWLYLGAGRALRDVVNTEGNDVELLMRALDRLATAFRNEVIVTGIAVVLFVALAFATRL